MKDVHPKRPAFLEMDEASKKEVLDNITNCDMSDKQRSTTLESMTFIDYFDKQLKNNPNITIKQVKKLWALHAERLKKTLLAQ
jgi:hypothetical protein